MSQRVMRFNFGLATAAVLALVGTTAGQYSDTKFCVVCHESPELKRDFCDAVPASVWRQDDKHRRAFELLHEANSPDAAARDKKQALVRQILGFDLREAFVDDRYSRLIEPSDETARNRVMTVKACLRCHGTWPKETDDRFASIPPVPLDLGVSCQACHGPGDPWLNVHIYEGWRRVTPEAKASLGCTDCRSPIAKSKLCASCHVGNIPEEKFVKHEWYAAGHPPLPSFELSSFEAQMPRHWKSLREKGAFKYRDSPSTGDEPLPIDQRLKLEHAGVPAEAIKASYLAANFPAALAKGLDPLSEWSGLKDAIVDGSATYATYVRLIADYAGQASSKSWPELALYDCAACHHELRSGLGAATRPKRNHIPGRPPLATWPEALARLAARQADGYQTESEMGHWSRIRGFAQKLDGATTRQPFGDPASMTSAAADLASSLERLAVDTMSTRFDEHTARAALQFLTDPRNYEITDFYTARQASWAITAIMNDATPSADQSLFSQNSGDPLALLLPSGPNASVMNNLRRWLSAASKYDPAQFRQELERINQGPR
jgi:hypothetical protein